MIAIESRHIQAERKKEEPNNEMVSLKGDDAVLCQITSKKVRDSYAISLVADDFKSGKLGIILR